MIIKVGSLAVDTDTPCDVVTALEMVRMQVAAGSSRKAVWFGDDKVEYSSANIAELKKVIADWQRKCDVASGRVTTRRRGAARFIM